MKIFVLCNEEQRSEMETKNTNSTFELCFFQEFPGVIDEVYDAWLLLIPSVIEEIFSLKRKEYMLIFNDKPVVLNLVASTLSRWGLPQNFLRICGWSTFLKREIWEVAGSFALAQSVFTRLGWQWCPVKDVAGLVAPRVIAMIINEAHFALREKISTKEEINMAMKLGTNYPYGPFEWEEIIGAQNILALLKELSKTNVRYIPAFAPSEQV